MKTSSFRWSVEWRSKNRLDGKRNFLLGGGSGLPRTFRTRREAREYVEKRYGYIRSRKDLQAEPHGWKVPRVVQVLVAWKVVG